MIRKVPVLLPGTYRLSPTPRFPRGQVVKYTRSDAARVVRQGNEQIKAGLVHPLAWMHPPGLEPAYLSTLNESAWVAHGYIGKSQKFEEGENGEAYGYFDIGDPKDLHQFDKVGRVSPCLLNDWVDETGKTWPGLSMVHTGVTPTPIQRKIGKATPAYLSHSKPNPALRLRTAELQRLSFPITKRSQKMADEIVDIDESEDKVAVDTDGDGDTDVVGDVGPADAVKVLAKHGMLHLGDPKDWDEFLVALKAAVATDMGGDGDSDDTYGGDDGDTDADTEVVTASPMMMSWAIKAAKVESKEINQRLDELRNTGRIDQATYARLQNDLKEKVNLSHEPHKKFNKAGELKRFDTMIEIAAYEKLPKGKTMPQSKANLSNTAPVANKVKEDEVTPESDKAKREQEVIDYIKSRRDIK